MNRSKDWEPEIHCQDSSSADGWGAPWRNAPFCVERIPTVVLLIRPSTQPRNSGQTGHVVRYGSEIKRNAKLLDLMFNFMRQNWKRRWVKASLEEQETSGRGGDIQQVVTSRSLFMALTEMLPPPPHSLAVWEGSTLRSITAWQCCARISLLQYITEIIYCTISVRDFTNAILTWTAFMKLDE